MDGLDRGIPLRDGQRGALTVSAGGVVCAGTSALDWNAYKSVTGVKTEGGLQFVL